MIQFPDSHLYKQYPVRAHKQSPNANECPKKWTVAHHLKLCTQNNQSMKISVVHSVWSTKMFSSSLNLTFDCTSPGRKIMHHELNFLAGGLRPNAALVAEVSFSPRSQQSSVFFSFTLIDLLSPSNNSKFKCTKQAVLLKLPHAPTMINNAFVSFLFNFSHVLYTFSLKNKKNQPEELLRD